MNKVVFVLLTASLVGAQTWAGSITIPNTFSNGTTASAGEVNANFNAIESAVNDNNSNITTNASDIQINAIDMGMNSTSIGINSAGIVTNTNANNTNTSDIKTNGVNIGINATDIQTNAASISSNVTDIQNNTTDISRLNNSNGIGVLIDNVRVGSLIGIDIIARSVSRLAYVLLNSNYIAPVSINAGGLAISGSGYTTTDCTGQYYVDWNDDPFSDYTARQGIIFKSFNPAAEYSYIVSGTQRETVQLLSAWNFTEICILIAAPTDDIKFKAYPNDPAVTGVNGAKFIGTFTLGY